MKGQNTKPALIFVKYIRQLKGSEYFVNSTDHNNALLKKLNTDMRSHGEGCREGGSEIDEAKNQHFQTI